jgi:OOP family OmpA-OmpF porin
VLLSNSGEAGDDTSAAGASSSAGASGAAASNAAASGTDASGGAAAVTNGASGASNVGTDSGGASTTLPPPTGSTGAGPSQSSSCPFGAPELVTGLGLSGSSWAPAISADGLTLYFSNDSAGSEDVYQATRSDRGSAFSAAVALSALDTSDDDGAPCPSADGLTLYFYSTRGGGVGARDLYSAIRATSSDEFAEPVLLDHVNSSANDHLPRISADGLTLIFTSARGTSGDLWVATRASSADSFGTPVALPGSINTTSAAEASGGLSSDGLRLYFDSNRAGGAGGYDMYMATRATTSDTFADPVALSALNTPAADYNIFVSADDQELFFSSNRVSSATYQLYRSLRTCP